MGSQKAIFTKRTDFVSQSLKMASLIIRKQMINTTFLKNSSLLLSSYNVKAKHVTVDTNSASKDQNEYGFSEEVKKFCQPPSENSKKSFLQEPFQIENEPFLIEGGKGTIRTAQIMPLYEGER